MTEMFYDFFKAFLQIVERLSGLLFSFKIYGTLSVGDLMVAIFIAKIAFTILIKGANVSVDALQSRHAASVRRREAAARRR